MSFHRGNGGETCAAKYSKDGQSGDRSALLYSSRHLTIVLLNASTYADPYLGDATSNSSREGHGQDEVRTCATKMK